MADAPKMGRPEVYTDEKADAVLARIMGGESLRQICRDPDMPSRPTVYGWIANRPEFADRYARASEVREDDIFDEMTEIADDAQNDWMERNGAEDAGWALNGENIQRSKLRIETRKWALAKMRPKKYGDRTISEVTHRFADLPDEELEAEIARLSSGQ
jgi:hypothetical protein